mgnify:CR=1 FL=1
MMNTRFPPQSSVGLTILLMPAIVCISLFLPLQASGEEAAGQEVSFNRDIRPILAANCFLCHGPDKKARKARLRFDEEKSIIKAFREKDLTRNKAWKRINSKDEEKVMPPPDSHKKLTAREIAKSGAWIKGGASWQGHWAYVTPKKPGLPAVTNKAWTKNPIDHFLLASLERNQLKPSSEAEKEMLIRRVSLDLLSLIHI